MTLPPDIDVDEKEMQVHKFDSILLLLFTFLLTLTVLTIWLFKHRRIAFVHETGLAIVYGLVMGAILKYGVNENTKNSQLEVVASSQANFQQTASPPDQLFLQNNLNKQKNKTWIYEFKGEIEDVDSEIDEKATFDPEIFFNILLPPIIFHAGYSMKKRYFFRNLGSIFTFAFIGTAISTFSVGGFMYGICQLIPHLNNITFIDNLHFGALISATDPVTVLAIFSDLNVDVTLHALVFGESVLNDAVAIVFSETLKDYEENTAECGSRSDCSYSAFQVLKAMLDFVGIFGASFLVGAVLGCVTSLLTKFTQIRQHPLLESALFVLMSYSTFLLAEVFELTGIVAVLFCGITQAHYTYNNLSTQSQESTKQVFDIFNFMAENFIFSYIGVSMFTFPKHRFDSTYTIGAFVAILVGRFLNVYPLSAFLNIGRKNKIPGNIQHMMMFSGLRGAIAFALAIRNTSTESRQLILSTTLIIVIVTVIFNGGMAFSMLGWLGIPIGVEEEIGETAPFVNSPLNTYQTVEGDSGNATSSHSKQDKSLMARQWSDIDNKFLKPLLTHCNPTLLDTMPTRCLPLGRIFTSNAQLANHPLMNRDESTDTDLSALEKVSTVEIESNGSMK